MTIRGTSVAPAMGAWGELVHSVRTMREPDRKRFSKHKPIRKPHDAARPGKGKPQRRAHPRPGASAPKPRQANTHWGEVADWYDKLVGEEGSEFHREVIFPGVLRL